MKSHARNKVNNCAKFEMISLKNEQPVKAITNEVNNDQTLLRCFLLARQFKD